MDKIIGDFFTFLACCLYSYMYLDVVLGASGRRPTHTHTRPIEEVADMTGAPSAATFQGTYLRRPPSQCHTRSSLKTL